MIGFFVLFAVAAIFILLLLFLRLTSLNERVNWLERKLDDLIHERTEKPAAPVQPVQPQRAAPSRSEQPPERELQPSSTPPPVQAARGIPAIEAKRPSRTRAEFEAFVGGKLLNRIGALALVMGMGFFLKYAFDNNWINESMRVVIGLGAGIGVLVTGVRTEKKGFAIFAQGLFGAGIAILYLSVYASFNFYHLVPQGVAFGVMSAVTILGFLVAVRYDSLAISLLSWTGGFLTPFLLSTGGANEVGLFAYIVLLEAGLLALVLRKPAWSVLGILTLAGTYLVHFAWRVEYYADGALAVTLVYATLFWLLLFLFDLFQTLKKTDAGLTIRQVMNLANACLYFSILHDLIDSTHHEWMGAATLLLCLAYLLQAAVIRKASGDPSMVLQNLFLSLILLVVATGIQYSGFTTVMLWSIEAAILIWCAVKWWSRNVGLFAFALFIVAGLKLFATAGTFGFVPLAAFSPIMNERAFTLGVVALSLLSAAAMLRRAPAAILKGADAFLDGAWVLTLFLLSTVEINDWYTKQIALGGTAARDHLDFTKFMAMAGAWTLLSLPIVFAGFKLRLRSYLIPGFLIVTMSFWLALIKGIAYAPIEDFSPLFNVRALALLIVGAGMTAHARWLAEAREDYPWAMEIGGPLGIAAIMLVLALLTGETRDLFEMWIFRAGTMASGGADEAAKLENLKQLSLSGLWLAYGGVLMGVGLWRRQRGLRIAAIALLGIAILKIFIYDLSFLEALYRIFSFIGLGVILLAASYLYQKYKSIIIEDAPAQAGKG